MADKNLTLEGMVAWLQELDIKEADLITQMRDIRQERRTIVGRLAMYATMMETLNPNLTPDKPQP